MISLIKNFIIFTITICIIILVYFTAKKLQKFSKKQIKQKINNINSLKDEIYKQMRISYPSIYYELKKIDDFVSSGNFKDCPIKGKKEILKHLKDIEDILIKIRDKKNAINKQSVPYMLLLTYNQIIQILKDKYGEVPGNYFLDKQCTKINKDIKRSSEGLHIHHIKGNEIKGLSNFELSPKAPFDYQKQNNLVYCNLIEHFLLHCKLWDYPTNQLQSDLGKNQANILLKKIQKIYYNRSSWQNEYHKRREGQKIYFQQKPFHKVRSFFWTLETIKNLQN